jgi:hypothetical protein
MVHPSSPRLPHPTESGRPLPFLIVPAIFVVIGFVVFVVVASIAFVVVVSTLLSLLLLFILSLLILLIPVLLPSSLHASSTPFSSSSPWLPPSWSLIRWRWVPLIVIGFTSLSWGGSSRRRWVEVVVVIAVCRRRYASFPEVVMGESSPDPPSSETKPPTSLWKGEGRLGCILASEGAEAD